MGWALAGAHPGPLPNPGESSGLCCQEAHGITEASRDRLAHASVPTVNTPARRQEGHTRDPLLPLPPGIVALAETSAPRGSSVLCCSVNPGAWEGDVPGASEGAWGPCPCLSLCVCGGLHVYMVRVYGCIDSCV